MQAPGHFTPPDRLRRTARSRTVISLTPLIDVVFILLVFFMLASSFLDWRSITLDTVKAPSAARDLTETRSMTIGVSATDIRVDGESMTMDAMLERVQQRRAVDSGVGVRIQPLGDTRLQAVIDVLDRLNAAGITGLNMVPDRGWSASNAPGR